MEHGLNCGKLLRIMLVAFLHLISAFCNGVMTLNWKILTKLYPHRGVPYPCLGQSKKLGIVTDELAETIIDWP